MSANGNPYQRPPEKFIYPKLSERLQWIDFELRANLVQYKRNESAVTVPWVWLNINEVKSRALTESGSKILVSLKEGDRIRIPKHPFNTLPSVPLFSKKSDGFFLGHLTASRSIYLETSTLGVETTVKLATNRPFGPKTWWNPRAGRQNQKAKGGNTIARGMDLSHYLLSIRKLRSAQAKIPNNFLPEALSIEFGDDGIVLFRDLSAMKLKHHYMPGTASIFALREMSNDFLSIMLQAYVFPKARDDVAYFLDDGFIRNNATPQNILIELNEDYQPTFQHLLRDFDDQRISNIHKELFKEWGFFLPEVEGVYMGFKPHEMLESTFMNLEVSIHEADDPYLIPLSARTALRSGYESVFLEEWNRRMRTQFNSIQQVETSLTTPEFKEALRSHLVKLYGKSPL